MPQFCGGEPFTEKSEKSVDLISTHGNRALSRSIETTKTAHFLSDKANILIKQKRLLQRATAFRIYPILARKKFLRTFPIFWEAKYFFQTGRACAGSRKTKGTAFAVPPAYGVIIKLSRVETLFNQASILGEIGRAHV